MSERDVIIKFPGSNVAQASNEPTLTRARAFRIKTALHNFAQYVRTVKAYALAKMPFRHVANAADFLGDEVIRNEIDAPIQNRQENQVGEIIEDEHQILAWQTRDPEVVTSQLPAPVSITGQEVVIVFNDLTPVEPTQEKTLNVNVIEGIKVFTQNTTSVLPNSTTQSEENPYLQPIDIFGDREKAA